MNPVTATTTPNGTPPDRELEPHERYVPAHHWRNARDEAEAAKLGMWLFLGTEIILFSGFFCAYGAFRMWYPENWHEASQHYLNANIGTFNTSMLLLSSWTFVLAIRAAQNNRKGLILLNLAITELCAGTFLVVKIGWEYLPKIRAGELPGGFFSYHDPVGPFDHIFLSIYWIATATHGLHVFGGMIIIGWAMYMAAKGHYGPRHYTSLENIGLYWHVVDVIWIFLYPLLYLV